MQSCGDEIMAKPAKPPKPEKKKDDDVVIVVLTQILQKIADTNKLLRVAEANNERRHKELLAVLNPSARHIKFTFGKPEMK